MEEETAMQETSTTQARKGKKTKEAAPRPVTFEDTMSAMLGATEKMTGSAGKLVFMKGVALPVIGMALGVGVRFLIGGSTVSAVLVSCAGLAGLAVLLGRSGHGLARVDWSTAPPYWVTARARLSGQNLAVIEGAVDDTRRRYRRITNVWFYLHPCPHTSSQGCPTHACSNAGAMRVKRRRVVYLEASTASLPADDLASIVYHEIRHTTGFMVPLTAMFTSIAIAGWTALGYTLPGWRLLPAALALYIAMTLWVFAIELLCDYAAIKMIGTAAMIASFRRERQMQRTSLIAQSWRVWAKVLLYSVLCPSHPPIVIRIAFARALTREFF
jgi:hypothetical protein